MAKYTKQTWTDGSGGGTPVSAARLAVIETGVYDATFGRGTSFPGSPVDGEQYDYVADATNGIIWHFIYNSGSASTFKWEFRGGPPLYARVDTDTTTSSTSYVDLDSGTPSITVPRAGDYDVEYECNLRLTATAPNACFASVAYGGTAAADAVSVEVSPSGVGLPFSASRRFRVTGLAASDVVKQQYRVGGGTGSFRWRTLAVYPVRVS